MANKKNNILKTIVSAGLAAVSIMSVGFSAFADEVNNEHTNLVEMNAIEASSSADDGLIALTTASQSNTLDVPYYNQRKKWYCGPATALQTYDYFYKLKYGRISPMTLDQMAGNFTVTENAGTVNNDEMLEYLNSCGLGCNYSQLWWWSDVNSFTEIVCGSIDDGVPVIAWVKSPNSTYPLGYTTPGHLLNVSGYDSYGAKFELTDPYYDGHHLSSGKYYVSNTAFENITWTISYFF